ncbi:MAG TPA: hypothetical protein VHZ95_18400, partial [Polyangiales bacterium]|nr:hypothetical protein [Polyangiales bacterium]
GVTPRSPREVRRLLIEQRSGEARGEELERELSTIDRERAARVEAETQWRIEWRANAHAFGFAERASAAEIDVLLDARADYFRSVEHARNLEREWLELEQELSAFEVDARALCMRYSKSVPEPIDVAAEQLIGQHQSARAAQVRHQQLTAAGTARRLALATAEELEARADRELQRLMAAAQVHGLPALEAVELASARARQLDASLEQLHDELFAASDGIDIELVLHDAPGSLDEVRARLSSLDERIEELERDRTRVAQTLAGCRAGLDRLRESHGASDAALEAATQLDNVRTLAEQYVRTRLAESLLRREVTRYREQNKGAVLRVAGALFERLTLSAFSGLDVDYTASDEPVLTCVREDGSRLGVEGLSTGTRDQLYLALRLASLEHLASRQELMPLVLDDILIHFDDDRARAALDVLADFASTTQVLLFTHHRRLCELASAALADRVRIHRLADASPRVVSLYS